MTITENLGTAIGPFSVYEDYDDILHIIDGNERIILSDSYAYDGTDRQTTERMNWLCAALNQRWKEASK